MRSSSSDVLTRVSNAVTTMQAMEVYLIKTIKGLRDTVDKALMPPKAKKGKAAPHVAQQARPCFSCAVKAQACSMGMHVGRAAVFNAYRMVTALHAARLYTQRCTGEPAAA